MYGLIRDDRKVNIFFDMDGVQTIYGRDESVEDMRKPGYFLSREPREEIIRLIKLLAGDEYFSVTILSAVFDDNHSVGEKREWLNKYGLGDIDSIFVPCTSSKGEYVHSDGMNILIDDFSKNLFEWENCGDNYIGIKYMNEINGSRGSWQSYSGRTIDCGMSAEDMYAAIIVYAISYFVAA